MVRGVGRADWNFMDENQVVITLFLAVFSFIQYHTSFYRAVFFNWKLWKADKYQYIFNYTNSWPKWITMLEYWLRGRGNRALLQSQSTTWRAYCRGVLWRCIWCTCIWRLRETSVNLLKKRERKKKPKQREYHLKSESLIFERSVQKLSWVIRNEQPRLKKNEKRGRDWQRWWGLVPNSSSVSDFRGAKVWK